MPNQEAGLENLEPAVRLEEILDGQDIEPATRLEYFLKKAAEGGGSGGGLVEIKNVEPFQVPDLVNGGTRLFDPESDELWITTDPDAPYQQMTDTYFITNQNPPGIVDVIAQGEHTIGITGIWYEMQAFERAAVSTPKFCVKPSKYYGFEGISFTGYIIKPDTIVYKYTITK